ncbi:MAG: hypothetical protein IJU54_02490, partial [Alphaproteobacteria bacterium]|nr:hypothetical protein [Alphaproteobacteria bacterium]
MNWFGGKYNSSNDFNSASSQRSVYNNNLSISCYNDQLREIDRLNKIIQNMQTTTNNINPPLQPYDNDNASTLANADKDIIIKSLQAQNKSYYETIQKLTDDINKLNDEINQLKIDNFAYKEENKLQRHNSKRLLNLLRRERSNSMANSVNRSFNSKPYNKNIKSLSRNYSNNNLLDYHDNNTSRNISVNQIIKNEQDTTYSELLKPQIEEIKKASKNNNANRNTSQVKSSKLTYQEEEQKNSALNILNNKNSTGKNTTQIIKKLENIQDNNANKTIIKTEEEAKQKLGDNIFLLQNENKININIKSNVFTKGNKKLTNQRSYKEKVEEASNMVTNNKSNTAKMKNINIINNDDKGENNINNNNYIADKKALNSNLNINQINNLKR